MVVEGLGRGPDQWSGSFYDDVVTVNGDDISITGPTPLAGTATETLDDHRLAMTFAVAGLIARGTTTIDRAESAAVSYPGFFLELERLRA